MRLRNKKTGKVQTCDMVVITDEQIDGEIASLGRHAFIFRSIEQFNDQYEAYKPVEPLIKDEKIRKAVKAWAEASDVGVARVAPFAVFDIETSARIFFYGRVIEDKDYDEEKSYTIAELCGEKE